ncbi:MAG TPA: DUF2007-related protein [Bacteroidales bacterium]|nr:DUF2007-related protein [Bacteroidales bacterium]
MTVPEFLELFIKELEINPELREYYRLINDQERFLWRKAYLEQRLSYVNRQITNENRVIWDVGCGYATTAIFLTLNGHKVYGNTLEFYFDRIKKRLDYWSRFGAVTSFEAEYANLFDMPVKKGFYDTIIAQDTLHHLEPIDHALEILNRSLKPDGKLVVTEENGNSLFISLKNIKTRGFNRISYYYDERLNKTIPFGNENARSLKKWRSLLEDHRFAMIDDETEYIRLFPHPFFKKDTVEKVLLKESYYAKKDTLLRKLLFFGINFTAIQNKHTMENEKHLSPIEVFAGTQWEAALVKSLLDNAEVEAFLKDEIRGTTMPWQVEPGGIGAVKVVVHPDQLELAKQVVREFETNRKSSED